MKLSIDSYNSSTDPDDSLDMKCGYGVITISNPNEIPGTFTLSWYSLVSGEDSPKTGFRDQVMNNYYIDANAAANEKQTTEIRCGSTKYSGDKTISITGLCSAEPPYLMSLEFKRK